MSLQTRKSLKKYFEKGRLPSEDQFAELIDSMLHMDEEGFEKTPEDGFKIRQIRDGKLISFYEQENEEKPVWSIIVDLTKDDRRLHFLNGENKEILTLTPEGNVGINQKNAGFELDVAGTIASRGRIGEQGAKKVKADGNWHIIRDDLEGCNAFEIMAGVGGGEKSGKYALMHAFALKTYNARGKITYHQAHYGSRCNRIILRWKNKKNKKYKLEMKTPCNYGTASRRKKSKGNSEEAGKDNNIYIQYYITELWKNKSKDGSLNP